MRRFALRVVVVEMRESELHTDVKELFIFGSPFFFRAVVEQAEDNGGLLRLLINQACDAI